MTQLDTNRLVRLAAEGDADAAERILPIALRSGRHELLWCCEVLEPRAVERATREAFFEVISGFSRPWLERAAAWLASHCELREESLSLMGGIERSLAQVVQRPGSTTEVLTQHGACAVIDETVWQLWTLRCAERAVHASGMTSGAVGDAVVAIRTARARIARLPWAASAGWLHIHMRLGGVRGLRATDHAWEAVRLACEAPGFVDHSRAARHALHALALYAAELGWEVQTHIMSPLPQRCRVHAEAERRRRQVILLEVVLGLHTEPPTPSEPTPNPEPCKDTHP